MASVTFSTFYLGMSSLLDRHKNSIVAHVREFEDIKPKKLADKIIETIDTYYYHDEKDFFVCAGNKFRDENTAFMILSESLIGYNPLEKFILSIDEEYPSWRIYKRTEEDVLVDSKEKRSTFFSEVVFQTIYSYINPIFIISEKNTDKECRIIHYSG